MITGTVRVDSSTLTPKLTLPATVKTPTKGVKLSWSSAEKGVRYRVTVKVGKKNAAGGLVWSQAKKWLSTKSAGGTYKGSAMPFELKYNRSYRFTVTATDALGNHSSVTKAVRVPKR